MTLFLPFLRGALSLVAGLIFGRPASRPIRRKLYEKIPCKLFHCRNAFQRFRRLRLTEYQQSRQRLRRLFLRFLLRSIRFLIFPEFFCVCFPVLLLFLRIRSIIFPIIFAELFRIFSILFSAFGSVFLRISGRIPRFYSFAIFPRFFPQFFARYFAFSSRCFSGFSRLRFRHASKYKSGFWG